MAQMIPRSYDPEGTTHSERQVFAALADLPGSYVVLHSLHLPRHTQQVQGEIDFVVISARGVLGLEVKGGAVSQRGGQWYFDGGTQPGRSPFVQASDNAHSLRATIERHFRDARTAAPNPLVGYAVVLPHVVLEPQAVAAGDASIIPEVLLDRRDGLGDMAGFLNRCYDYWARALQGRACWQATLSRAEVHALKQALRGDFECLPPLSFWVERTERLLEREECEERLRYFDVAEAEPRIMLCGVAGSGKTMLSVEYARRRALAGDSVLFLCFNRNLCRYLDGLLDSRVMAMTFHEFLEAETPAERRPPRPGPGAGRALNLYYQQELPQAYVAHATATGRQEVFDCLVVDEGQDLLRPAYLACMELMVRGGLTGGRWQLAYDANQDIYLRDSAGPFASLLDRTRAYRYPLRLNHRNTAAIAIYNNLLTGFDCGRPRIALFEPPVTASPYDDRPHQLELVAGAVRRLLDGGVRRRDVVLLGRRTMANSCLRGEPLALGPDLPVLDLGRELTRDRLAQDVLKYCTIWSYKGIDAPAVVLVDLDRDAWTDKKLCHTAISRARTALVVLYDSRLRAEYDELMAGYPERLAEARAAAVASQVSAQGMLKQFNVQTPNQARAATVGAGPHGADRSC